MNNPYIDCYTNLEEYFLFKELSYEYYNTYKNWKYFRNEGPIKCIECETNYTFLEDKNSNNNCYEKVSLLLF